MIYFLTPYTVLANGRTGSLIETTEGHYKIELRSYPPEPRVGNMHFSLVINKIEDDKPVTDASLLVLLIGPAPEHILLGPIETEKDLSFNNWYDFTIDLSEEGQWLLEGELKHEDQITRINLTLEVYKNEFNWGVIAVLISTLPIVVSLAWYLRRINRSQSQI